jgi:uncharacterized protein YcfJ
MEAIKTSINRIHPLMAAAAASVIIVSLAGTAAITGVLPSSHSAPEAPMPTTQVAPAYAGALAPTAAPAMAAQGLQQVPVGYAQPAPAAYAQPATYAQQAAYAQQGYAQPVQAAVQPAPAPVVIEKTIIKEVPVKQAAPRPHTVHTSYARHEAPRYYEPAPRPAPQPNYVGIGTGAVIGGLIGNQVGSGNGRKLATVAGMIGGGMLGNQMINR